MFQNANYPIARYSYCTYYENTHFEDQLTNEKGNFGVFLNGFFFYYHVQLLQLQMLKTVLLSFSSITKIQYVLLLFSMLFYNVIFMISSPLSPYGGGGGGHRRLPDTWI